MTLTLAIFDDGDFDGFEPAVHHTPTALSRPQKLRPGMVLETDCWSGTILEVKRGVVTWGSNRTITVGTETVWDLLDQMRRGETWVAQGARTR